MQLQQSSELLTVGNQTCEASHRDCSKHCFEVADKTCEASHRDCSKHCFEVADKTCEASIKVVRFSSLEEHL
ncbi:hypothetical protein [Streptococcus anginosus]|uniref:hypothetical protein n=1 Tax=Streptococcus anginosus TaxID=1328 RepID=UPI001304C38C|nr:hypothetical protein [Streptococcus anginosus]